jgi:hypothetical protein
MSPQVACNGTCVDLQNDPMNCGQCGVRCCASCVNGSCWADGIGLTVCPTGPDGCHNIAVDTQTDVNNCGGCDHACGAGHVCVSGQCTA